MLAKEIKTTNKSIAVAGYDKSGKPLMWGTAKHCEVLYIEFTNESLKVIVDYLSK